MAIEKLGRVSSASVKKGTGKDWDEWVKILNRAGANTWAHGEIAAWLKKRHKLSPWWQQGVAIGFELAVGRRIEGRTLAGDYGLTATKSLTIDAGSAWDLFFSEAGLALWLAPLGEFELKKGGMYECDGGIFGEVRTFLAGRRVRLTWQETEWTKPSILQFQVVPRAKARCIVVIQHEKLTSAKLRERMRLHWRNGLEAVARSAEHRE